MLPVYLVFFFISHIFFKYINIVRLYNVGMLRNNDIWTIEHGKNNYGTCMYYRYELKKIRMWQTLYHNIKKIWYRRHTKPSELCNKYFKNINVYLLHAQYLALNLLSVEKKTKL